MSSIITGADRAFLKVDQTTLKINKAYGMFTNALRIKIYPENIIYYMMAIVEKQINIERFIYEILQTISISLIDTTNIINLFTKINSILAINLMVLTKQG